MEWKVPKAKACSDLRNSMVVPEEHHLPPFIHSFFWNHSSLHFSPNKAV